MRTSKFRSGLRNINYHHLRMSLSFFHLPLYPLVDILTRWIDVNDVGRLDSACCKEDIRNLFLSVIASEYTILPKLEKRQFDKLSFFHWIRKRNISVTELCLPRCLGSCNEQIVLTPKIARSLRILNLECCEELSDEVFADLMTYTFSSVDEVVLGSESYSCRLTDSSFAALSTCVPNISKFKLVQSPYVTDKGISNLVRGCSKLKEVYLLKANKLGDGSISALAAYCPDLTLVHMSHNVRFTHKALGILLHRAGKLSELSLVNCNVTNLPDLTEQVVEGNIVSRPNLQQCNLRHLTLSSSSTIADVSLGRFLPSCSGLKSLTLTDNQSITDVGAGVIATQFDNLTALTIDCCYRITEVGLLNIANNCRDLEYLHLHACRVSHDVLVAVSRMCCRLKHLSITWCQSITDSSLQYFADNCTTLEHLSLNGCGNITCVALQSLVQSCTHLHTLCVPYCARVTDAGVDSIRNAHPQLTITCRSFCCLP